MLAMVSKRVIIFSLSFFIFSYSQTSTAINFTKNSASLNDFAFDLYKQIERSDRNIIFSPYSLSSLLMILTAGAAGNTKAQLIKLLHLENEANLNANSGLLQNDPCHGILNCNAALIKRSAPKNPPDFLIANALWADANVSYKPFFLVNVKQNSGQFYQVDFKFPDSARYHINQWVEDNDSVASS